jgi:NTE family protein
MTSLIRQRQLHEGGAPHDHAELLVLPPPCPLSASATDFRHSGELIARAEQVARRWLDEGGDRMEHPERFLTRQTHHGATSTFADASGGHAA